MKKILDAYQALLGALLVAAVAVLMLPITMQVISRYTQLIPSYIWTEELSRFVFIWMVMLGAMVALRDKAHFEVDVWPTLAPRPNAALRIVTNLLVLVFALVYAWWGIEFVRFGWNQHSELADLPMTYIFIAWPVAGLTWVLFLGEQLLADLRTVAAGAQP